MNGIRHKSYHHSSQLLKDFGPAYFDHVVAEYELLPHDHRGRPPQKIQEILATHGKHPDDLTWGDLYSLEKYVLSIEPEETLRARSPGLENSYRELQGEAAYQAYLRSWPSNKRNNPLRALQARLARLLDKLHWTYTMIPEREEMRTEIVKESGKQLVMLILLLSPLGLLLAASGYGLFAITALVAIMGATGGFLSLQRRIQNISTDRDPLLTMLELQNGRFVVALAPLTGAIFAIILFLIFLGGLLKGTVFPDATNLLGASASNSSEQLINYGKLLLWSFVAGFAERFVPDTLDRLTLSAREAKIPVGTSDAHVRARARRNTGNKGKSGKAKRGRP